MTAPFNAEYLREDTARLNEVIGRALLDITKERGLDPEESTLYARFLLGGLIVPSRPR